MKERLMNIKTKFSGFWGSRTRMQKGTIIGSIIAVIIIASIITYFTTRVTYAPLYSDLSAAEVGQIKEQLDSKGVKYQVTNGGTAISVPEDQVDNLKVDLASQGYPQSGQIDYSFFSQNAGFGMTDNEFNVLKLASMQTELANLMKEVKGVKDAKVMITLPEKGVFVSDSQQEASASIVLNTEPGYQFTESQIKTLYNLASKSVPNLKPENIVITNQYFEYYDLNTQTASETGSGVSSTDSNNQLAIKRQIERDLQRQVQTMLGQLMGAGKAAVTVTTDIDFTQEKREENLVEPVDKENMAGIQISAQKINETYTGNGAAAGGTPEADQNTDNFTDYQSSGNGNGDYEKTEDTVNYEVNRIKRKITESPYRVRDIGIQVLVEPPKPGDPTSLPQATQDNIKSMLASIVRTSIDKNEAGQLSNAQVNQKVTVAVEKLNGKAQVATAQQSAIPWWVYVIGGILLVVIGLLVFFIIRSKRRQEYEDEEYEEDDGEDLAVDDISEEKDTEATLRRKQLEKMAKEKPEEFAKLLRTWISED
ncbi:flagellar basal-body MS-ring/collar protein FliF [Rummeliibacillus suwonensis]|uniref:flagellar basal-body MS-ring/collar protein FliF n=1 Tax=Rummeliibacillus suwonensis TaxID=1306154 RepID=UPI0011B84A9C|nr:flagellar basal-body MS-ring/collar protein FliF [Rummeliibacillus suwonensis]MBO2534570.1 flagellar M-ring protein FliF [Rummeliibacillus suwonensis]